MLDNGEPMEVGLQLSLDSVDGLELVVATEAAFGITLPQDALRSSLRTVNTLVDLIMRYQVTPEHELEHEAHV